MKKGRIKVEIDLLKMFREGENALYWRIVDIKDEISAIRKMIFWSVFLLMCIQLMTLILVGVTP